MTMEEAHYRVVEKGNTILIYDVIPNTITILGLAILATNSTVVFIFYAMGIFSGHMEMLALASFILVISPGLLFASMFLPIKFLNIDTSRQLIIFKKKSIDIYNISTLRIEPTLDSKKRHTFALNIIERGGDVHLLAKAGTHNLMQLALLLKKYANIELES